MGVISLIIGIVVILGSIIMIAGFLPSNLFIIFIGLSIIGFLLALKDKTKQKPKMLGLILNLLSLILLFLTGISFLTI